MARLRNPIERPSPLTSAEQTVLRDLWERGDDDRLLDFLRDVRGGGLAYYALKLDGWQRAEPYVQALLRGGDER